MWPFPASFIITQKQMKKEEKSLPPINYSKNSLVSRDGLSLITVTSHAGICAQMGSILASVAIVFLPRTSSFIYIRSLQQGTFTIQHNLLDPVTHHLTVPHSKNSMLKSFAIEIVRISISRVPCGKQGTDNGLRFPTQRCNKQARSKHQRQFE